LPAEASRSPTATRKVSTMHIVLVDGSRTGLMIVRNMLDRRGDTVSLFTDGQMALDFIRGTPDVDVLITSFEIATLPGTDLCWEARVLADGGRPLYVIAMSANNDPQHVIGVLDAGADDFMSKPPRQDELMARLRVAERTLTMQRRLIDLATRDPLSGLLNRRAFRDKTDAACHDLPSEAVVSLVLFDVDHFKRVNDVHGHDTGDDVIRAIGRLRAPPDTVFARMGGEEFALLLPDVPLEGAASVADYLRHQISALEIDVPDGQISVTASFGVAEMPAGGDPAALYRSADAALYHAKNSGRNRVSTMAPMLMA
jgi:two-component system cell cycle response regulator